MFQRQWFGYSSQIGLSHSALEFEELLNSRRFDKSHKIIATELSEAHRTRADRHLFYWTRQLSRLRAILSLYSNRRQCLQIYFTNFWPGFIPEESTIFELLRTILSTYRLIVTPNVLTADIVISSCFGTYHVDPRLPILASCLYLGENVRPSFTDYDFCFSFDEEEYCGRNVYLPLWYLRADVFKNAGRDSELIPCDIICKPQPLPNRGKSVVMIANNMTPQRMSFLEISRRYHVEVDCFGSSFQPVRSKIDTMKHYNYAVAFENSYFPGYVTEKVFDAYVSGAIPLYAGSNSSRCPINLNKVIDMTPYLQVGTLPSNLFNGSTENLLCYVNMESGLITLRDLCNLTLQIRSSAASFFSFLP